MTKTIFRLDSVDVRDSYRLLTGLVVPRPIGWIGTKGRDGVNNLAPFSFFNVVSTSPPTVVFAGGRHPNRPKDTVALAEATGVFTVNTVSETVVEAMSLTSGTYDPGADEFLIAGLTPVPGVVVDAPMVGESPANLECRVVNVIAIGDEGTSTMVVGEVVAMHVAEDVLDGTGIDHDALRAVGRMAGNTYIRTRDRFDIPRPGQARSH